MASLTIQLADDVPDSIEQIASARHATPELVASE
jgi:predicted transcriptional regulator